MMTNKLNFFYFVKHTDHSSVNLAQQQIHSMLEEVLGGVNCVRVAALTPYFYTVGEFNLQPHHLFLESSWNGFPILNQFCRL